MVERSGLITSPTTANNGSLFQYVANVQTSRYALAGTYTIYIFGDDPASENPSDWILDPNLIGPIGVLASEAMSSTNIVASGSIPLTRTLTAAIGSALADLTEANVVPYLDGTSQVESRWSNCDEVDRPPSTRLRCLGLRIDRHPAWCRSIASVVCIHPSCRYHPEPSWWRKLLKPFRTLRRPLRALPKNGYKTRRKKDEKEFSCIPNLQYRAMQLMPCERCYINVMELLLKLKYSLLHVVHSLKTL